MREIGIEYLRKTLSESLGDMPFIITRRGVKIAAVQPYSSGTDCTVVGGISHVDGVNLTVESVQRTPAQLRDEKPRLPSSRKQVLKAEVKAAEKDEFNPLKEPFRAVTHHRERE